MILDCTVYTLGLLFLGYFPGVSLGLVTGITFGYSEKARYWVNPVIKFFGPIPTSTWIPIMIAEMLGARQTHERSSGINSAFCYFLSF